MSRLRVDVYEAGGARRANGPLTAVLSFSYAQRLDEVGDFELVVPATDEHAASVQQGDELRFLVAGEGEVFRGMVDHAETEIDAEGTPRLVLTGSSVARELVWSNTLLNRTYEGATLADIVADLLAGTGWTAGTLDVPVHTLTARFDGLSTWSALKRVAELFGLHVREDPRTRTVDLGTFGEVADVELRHVEHVDPALHENQRVHPVASLSAASESRDLWNQVVPLGSGEGVNRLDLAYCDRSVAAGDPYDVSSASGPDGRPYYYLEDAASVTSYGRRVKPLLVKEAAPLANSTAGFRAAANALYDVAATWLQRRKDALTSYEVTVPGMRHVDAEEAPRVRPGDRVRVRYRGTVEEPDGSRRTWQEVDAELWMMGFERRFGADGGNTWRLTLNTVDRTLEDAAAAVARNFEDFFGLQVALKPYTYREVHGPQRESVQSGSRIEFTVRFDENVALLHQARLSVSVRPVRSNVTTAAAGGGQTPTSSFSSGTTNLVNLGPFGSSFAGNHSHQQGGNTLPQTPFGSDHYHWMDTGSFTGGAGGHSHQFSLGDHAHGMPAHNHSVTVNDHTHGLVYGIFEGPQPNTPGVELHINGGHYTVPLGGPWHADFEVDITEYLQDADGQPLRQENVLWFYATELVDLEVTLRSLVTATSLIPVG